MASDPADPPSDPLPKQRRRRARRLWLGGSVAVLLLLIVAGALLATLSVRRSLLAAQADLRQARADLINGDAAGAQHAFALAGERFHSVRGGAPGLFLKATGWMPGLGHSAETTLAIADAGGTASDAGGLMAAAVVQTPGGLAALSPNGGGFSIDALTPLTQAVSRADVLLTQALASVRKSPGSFLVGPVANARTLLLAQLGSLQAEVHSSSSILQGLPTFLGQDAPRNYLLTAQDPAEQRGTGGVIGAYTILTVDNGRFSFAPFKPIQSLPIPPLNQVPAPSAEYAKNYNQFRSGERFWLAINLTPDFPTAAQAILNAYKVAEGVQLDGVIFTDPFALKALLRVEGATEIPKLGTRVSAANVVSLVTNRAFSIFPNPNVRKQVLGAVATAVVQGFVHGPKVSIPDLKILAASVGEGHILVYSTDPVIEQGLRGTGAGGALPAASGDFLAVIENSAGANKVDYYQDRSVTYTAVLAEGGTAAGTTEVRLTNNAPTSGQPAYVIGPHPGFSRAGESSQLLNVYCGAACEFLSATKDGVPVNLGSGTELGHVFFQGFFRTPSGQTSDLRIDSFRRGAWKPSGSGGTYQLTYLGQTTVRPTTLRVVVVVPDGAHITSTSPSMQIAGTTAVWSGTPTHRMLFTVDFSG